MYSEYAAKNYNKDDLEFCDEILGKVSRSFASVIRQLPPEVAVDAMVFYLVLRALDTVEDDMTAFKNVSEKTGYLLQFHKTALVDPKWTLDGVGEADEKRLLQNFDKCHRVYAALKPESRVIIEDITRRMAEGMAEFVDKVSNFISAQLILIIDFNICSKFFALSCLLKGSWPRDSGSRAI